VLPVVIPAAGLGSRLGPLTKDCPKELLPIGGRPALHSAMLELEAAGAEQTVIVTSPRKPRIGEWVRENAPQVQLVSQPEPLGVFDAVERAREVLAADRFVVLFPDYVHLPDQTALAVFLGLVDQLPPEATVYPLVRRGPQHEGRLGPTASVTGRADGELLRIESVGGVQPAGLHTVFAELRGTEHSRRLAGGDEGIGTLLQGLADDGLLFGVELPGEVLDIGVPGGHADAVARFAAGGARWRQQ
jgi:hypothetical protein